MCRPAGGHGWEQKIAGREGGQAAEAWAENPPPIQPLGAEFSAAAGGVSRRGAEMQAPGTPHTAGRR